MKYPVPNDDQEQMLVRNGIDPKSVCVVHQTDETTTFKHYKSGDEIQIRENACIQNRRKMGW